MFLKQRRKEIIIISTSCITLIDIHYPRVQKYIVYWKGLKLIRRGVDSWAVFLLRPVNKVYSGLQDKEKASSLGGLFTDNFYCCKVPHCYLLITLSLIVAFLCSRWFRWQNRLVLANQVSRGAIQYNTITLFKEGSAITYYSFLTYGPHGPCHSICYIFKKLKLVLASIEFQK